MVVVSFTPVTTLSVTTATVHVGDDDRLYNRSNGFRSWHHDDTLAYGCGCDCRFGVVVDESSFLLLLLLLLLFVVVWCRTIWMYGGVRIDAGVACPMTTMSCKFLGYHSMVNMTIIFLVESWRGQSSSFCNAAIMDVVSFRACCIIVALWPMLVVVVVV